MKPYYQDSWVTIWHGDCREVLPLIGNVDAVITDPPYGIGFKYESHEDSPEGYGDFLWSVIEAAENKCNPLSPVFVFQAMLNVRNFSAWFPREWRLYAAAKNFVQIRPTVMQYAYDPVVCWWTAGEGKPWTAGTESRDFFVANTAAQVCNKGNIEKGHPCPRPLDQMIVLVSQWVPPGLSVVDPFMGSGTTGTACAMRGRNFVGIERERKYFDIACRRIEQAYAQPRLFEDAKVGAGDTAVQGDMLLPANLNSPTPPVG